MAVASTVMRTVPSEPCTGAADSSKRSILRLWYEESDEVSSHSDADGWCAVSPEPLTRFCDEVQGEVGAEVKIVDNGFEAAMQAVRKITIFLLEDY